jgi:NDP-sugar pyrophosphorylase family protein
MATMALAPVSHLARHRIVETDTGGVVTSTALRDDLYKNQPATVGPVHAGYVLYKKEAVLHFAHESHDLGWDPILIPLIEKRIMKGVFYPYVDYFNVGTPEEFEEAQAYFEEKIK